ncbi:MAG: dihydroorotase family protein [Parasphingopyxis sp.]|nr:dihydroorotase [Sphingomonadales bacterium]
MTALTITGGTLIRPSAEDTATGDLHIDGDTIVDTAPADAESLDASRLCIAPGIVDLGVFAIDAPGFIAGGITRAALMPDQSPVLDQEALVRYAAVSGKPELWVHPLAAATKGLEGRDLAEIGLMQRAGAVAVSTGRKRIADAGLMHKVLAYAAALGMIVVTNAEDEGLVGEATATNGETALRLGLAGAPAIAEAMAIARDIMLAEDTGGHVHFREVTTARGFDLIREAKRRGVKVSCGITPAHLLLCDVDIGAYRTFARLAPPLRSAEDRDAAKAALGDGTIDVICSGHDPRGAEAKRLPYADAAPGMAGAETLLPLSLILVREGLVTLPRLFELLSANPARLLGVPGGSLEPGAPADILLFDADKPWKIDSARLAAAAGNTPFDGLPVQGKAVELLKGGRRLVNPNG